MSLIPPRIAHPPRLADVGRLLPRIGHRQRPPGGGRLRSRATWGTSPPPGPCWSTTSAAVRATALSALARMGAATPADVAAALADPVAEVRRRACEVAVVHADVDLRPLLADADPMVVEAAAWALGERGEDGSDGGRRPGGGGREPRRRPLPGGGGGRPRRHRRRPGPPRHPGRHDRQTRRPPPGRDRPGPLRRPRSRRRPRSEPKPTATGKSAKPPKISMTRLSVPEARTTSRRP